MKLLIGNVTAIPHIPDREGILIGPFDLRDFFKAGLPDPVVGRTDELPADHNGDHQHKCGANKIQTRFDQRSGKDQQDKKDISDDTDPFRIRCISDRADTPECQYDLRDPHQDKPDHPAHTEKCLPSASVFSHS